MSISPCHPSRFSAEFQLACLCCRHPLTDADRAEITRRLAKVDAPAFIDLVITRHRIGPLVHAVLAQWPTEQMPPGLIEALAACARENAVNALRSMRTHVLLARWFGEAGIEWMPFKGISVAHRYYRDVALRQVNDLDVWVPKSRLIQARAILESKGFQLDVAARHWDLADRGPRHLDYLLRYFFEEQHYSREYGALELHWHVTSNASQFSIAPEALLARSEPIAMGGVSMNTMGHLDLLLYLCEHGGRHGWYRLKWLADLPRLLADRDLDWPDLFDRARRAGSTRTLLLGLALCRDLFGWMPPGEVAVPLRSMRLLPAVLGTVRSALLAPQSVYAGDGHLPLKWRLQDSARALMLSASMRALRSHLWRRSLSPKDLRIVELPDNWFGLYYLLRPFLFAMRHWRA